jgi:two-component system sensor histidine kinase KdpD
MRVRKQPSDVQDVIGSALVQAARRLAGHPLETEIPDNLPDVPMDFVLMVQVLYNLLDNAAKYSPPDGKIKVAAQMVGEEMHIRVTDIGVGIPAEDLQRVFGKFYRVQRLGGAGGTGLGLSICRGIVEVHGGRIWAENGSSGGVVMTVALPLQAEALLKEGG